MFNMLKDQFKANLEMGTRMFDEGVERQVKFATEMMSINVEGSKKLRAVKSVSDAVEVQKSYLQGVQSQVTSLNTGNTAALKELRDNASEVVSSAVQYGKEAVKAKTANTSEATSEEAPAAAKASSKKKAA